MLDLVMKNIFEFLAEVTESFTQISLYRLKGLLRGGS